mmetsp:Transcript_68060/g.168157  ORF Transcript_68060/g.168157 Transcript_68060/m.168157 type:complete len:274 (-) Transcript_68060:954-1775(-)
MALDVRLTEPVNVHDPLLVQLAPKDRDRRPEHPQQTPRGRGGHLPNAEETEDVVDTIRVEVVGHGAEACTPPREAVLTHVLPVVGGESPVLAFLCVVVGGGACLLVHVEQVGLEPCVNGVVVDADGQVSLEGHALLLAVPGCLPQLQVQPVLHAPVVRHALEQVAARRRELHELLLGDLASPESTPLLVVGGAKEVPEPAEHAIGAQPALRLLEELEEARVVEGAVAYLLVKLPQEPPLGLHHLRVVHRAVKLCLEVLIPLRSGVVLGVVEAL